MSLSPPTPPYSASETIRLELKSHIGRGIYKRRYDYNSIIITLYGLLENFIENTISGYVNQLSTIIPSYNLMPDSIKKYHTELSFSLIKSIERNEHKSISNITTAVSRLDSCLRTPNDFKINSDSFALHSANFRLAIIESTFNRMGVSDTGKKIRSTYPMSTHITSKYPGRKPDEIDATILFYYLNDLAERRNEVAHGKVSQLLRSSLLSDHIDFIEILCQTLYNMLEIELIPYLVLHKCIKIGQPYGLIMNNKVILIEVDNIDLSVGETIISISNDSNPSYKIGIIEEIQVNKITISKIKSAPNVKAGIRIDFEAHKNHTYALLRL